ncbi:type VI secretion system tip protein VgrG [Pendulispora brunnea]|uniref:Type VI secretion system tip protein VgrG n=1 Tax=Pendulispora brunnea TaxID=2905690 RepID=A0ABZ2KH71_9BACT
MDSPADVFGAIHEDLSFQLTITDLDTNLLRVASFRAVEELSVLFQYTIVVGIDPEDIAKLEEALGRDATFVIERDDKPVRRVRGIITDVSPDGAFVRKSQSRVVLTLEPRLANLRYSGGFRIFQEKAVHEIVTELCQAEQIECLWYVRPVPQKRTYCTQLDESDLEFITRLASEEGMHFYFKHDEDKTSVVFSNEPRGYEPVAPDLSLSFNETQGAVSDEHVRSIQRTQRVRVGAFEHRDYNFLEPGKSLMSRVETPGKETAGNSHKREWRDYPGRFIDKDGPGKALAQQRLDEMRSDAFVLVGSAYSPRLVAGATFSVTGHRDEGFNRSLLLTRVELEGSVEGALQDVGGFRGSLGLTSFVAVPAEVPIRPTRWRKPPSRIQSARVVGPKDGDPFVDDRGRVKVQFFWDRDGKFNENSSCWIRMMTPVAHVDEGFWQAHKVGSEVIVGFIDDDIDRPLIMGAVYNAIQSQPHPLPSQVAKSTWKTKSIPGNAGFNEITQDNTAGNENLFMHAQKNRSTVVLANHTETVGANQTSTIGANQTVTVGASQTVTVGAARSVTVGAAHTVSVGADETNSVKGKRTETVDTGESVTVKAGRSHTISGGDTLGVTGDRAVTVSAKDSLKALSKEDVVDTTFDLNAGTSITIHHGGDSTLTLKAGEATLNTTSKIVLSNPSGTITLGGGKVEIVAASEVSLGAGAAKLSLKSDGTVAVSGAKEVGVACNSSSVKLEPAQATFNGAKVNVTATGMMEISGALIKIN